MELNYEIIPGKGAGPFQLGLSQEELIVLLEAKHLAYKQEKTRIAQESIVIVEDGQIIFSLSAKTQKVFQIVFDNRYAGKLWGRIGFGDLVTAVGKLKNETGFLEYEEYPGLSCGANLQKQISYIIVFDPAARLEHWGWSQI